MTKFYSIFIFVILIVGCSINKKSVDNQITINQKVRKNYPIYIDYFFYQQQKRSNKKQISYSALKSKWQMMNEPIITLIDDQGFKVLSEEVIFNVRNKKVTLLSTEYNMEFRAYLGVFFNDTLISVVKIGQAHSFDNGNITSIILDSSCILVEKQIGSTTNRSIMTIDYDYSDRNIFSEKNISQLEQDDIGYEWIDKITNSTHEIIRTNIISSIDLDDSFYLNTIKKLVKIEPVSCHSWIFSNKILSRKSTIVMNLITSDKLFISIICNELSLENGRGFETVVLVRDSEGVIYSKQCLAPFLEGYKYTKNVGITISDDVLTIYDSSDTRKYNLIWY